jgi:hypothetical protein
VVARKSSTISIGGKDNFVDLKRDGGGQINDDASPLDDG